MGATKIEWADVVWNPVSGCTKVSAGCANCYAERMAKRFPQIHGLDFMPAYPDYIGPTDADPVPFSRVVTHPDRLGQPLAWRKPRRVFVCSMGDLFHAEVPLSFVEQVWLIMHEAHKKFGHTFMILTKRPERMMTALGPSGVGWYACDGPVPRPEPGIWLGVSVENQETADERIPLLLQTPAAVRFVSVEPMLDMLDLGRSGGLPVYHEAEKVAQVGMPGGDTFYRPGQGWVKHDGNMHPYLDWVICGGETGPGARPMRPDWARSLRDQCQASGVPFFFKHWGEWAPGVPSDDVWCRRIHDWPDGETSSCRIGKKAAGRLLDGREWNEFPCSS